jgi:hypothetical protein
MRAVGSLEGAIVEWNSGPVRTASRSRGHLKKGGPIVALYLTCRPRFVCFQQLGCCTKPVDIITSIFLHLTVDGVIFESFGSRKSRANGLHLMKTGRARHWAINHLLVPTCTAIVGSQRCRIT